MQLQRFSVVILTLSVFQVEVLGEYKSEVHLNCGRRLVNHEALIVNGYESKEGDWPWHASILHIDRNLNIQYKCGGTLLDSNSILTAAHCVYENGRPLVAERVLIQLGRHNLKLASTSSQEIEVYQTFPHHGFNESSLVNDIAIIRLATKAAFNNYVQPICLWNPNKEDISSVVGKYGTVVGFGITEENQVSYVLRQATIPVIDLTTCLQSDRNFFGHFLSESTFCAGYSNGTTACNGDSGGSLTFEENGVYRIRGIVSLTQVRRGDHNRFCKTDQYVIFTDVAKYLDWIQEIVPGLTSSTESIPVTYDESSKKINYCYFLNNDLTNARIGRDDCEGRCASTPNCTHFTWTNFNDGTCWMKQNTVTTSDAHRSLDRAAVCGIVKNSAHIAWNGNDFAFGCDFWENDFDNFRTTAGNECKDRCVATAGCTHFVWTYYNGGTCWMKQNSVGKSDAFVSKDKLSICGIVTKIEWNEDNSAVGCDFRGNDLRNVRGRSEDCVGQCRADWKCTHYTWNGAFGGTCWMKHFSSVTKSDALVNLDPSSICGVI